MICVSNLSWILSKNKGVDGWLAAPTWALSKVGIWGGVWILVKENMTKMFYESQEKLSNWEKNIAQVSAYHEFNSHEANSHIRVLKFGPTLRVDLKST
jgi:hypothetical protein